MSTDAFLKAWRAATSAEQLPDAFRHLAEVMQRQLVDTERKLEERSEDHRKERERGAHLTKHRVSI